jgi:hypothetical protein
VNGGRVGSQWCVRSLRQSKRPTKVRGRGRLRTLGDDDAGDVASPTSRTTAGVNVLAPAADRPSQHGERVRKSGGGD